MTEHNVIKGVCGSALFQPPVKSWNVSERNGEKYLFEKGQKNQSVEMSNGYHQAVNVQILCVQVNYATSEELVKG